MNKMKMGNVSAWPEGDGMNFECECGAKELVKNYYKGARPENFSWQIAIDFEHARCNKCGKEYNGEIGKKYG